MITFIPRPTLKHNSLGLANTGNMELELKIAVEFLLSFVVKKFQGTDTEDFVKVLLKYLAEKFKGHWYPQQPSKGSGYRCIALNDQLDNVLISAATESGFDLELLRSSLPCRLNVWIDPKEISYRIGEHGSVTQIYREGDNVLNSESEYAMAVLKNLPSKHVVQSVAKNAKKEVKPLQCEVWKKSKSNASNAENQNRKSHTKDANRLSPTARSFVSRRSPPLPIQVPHAQTIANGIYTPKPISSWDHSRKAYWQPTAVYDPVSMQAHNFIVAHEIARFEAHMQAQRIALQTHYYKSPFHHVRRPTYSLPHVPVAPTQNNGHLRIQVMA